MNFLKELGLTDVNILRAPSLPYFNDLSLFKFVRILILPPIAKGFKQILVTSIDSSSVIGNTESVAGSRRYHSVLWFDSSFVIASAMISDILFRLVDATHLC